MFLRLDVEKMTNDKSFNILTKDRLAESANAETT